MAVVLPCSSFASVCSDCPRSLYERVEEGQCIALAVRVILAPWSLVGDHPNTIEKPSQIIRKSLERNLGKTPYIYRGPYTLLVFLLSISFAVFSRILRILRTNEIARTIFVVRA